MTETAKPEHLVFVVAQQGTVKCRFQVPCMAGSGIVRCHVLRQQRVTLDVALRARAVEHLLYFVMLVPVASR